MNLGKDRGERPRDPITSRNVGVLFEYALFMIAAAWDICHIAVDTICVPCDTCGDKMVDMERNGAFRNGLISMAVLSVRCL